MLILFFVKVNLNHSSSSIGVIVRFCLAAWIPRGNFDIRESVASNLPFEKEIFTYHQLFYVYSFSLDWVTIMKSFIKNIGEVIFIFFIIRFFLDLWNLLVMLCTLFKIIVFIKISLPSFLRYSSLILMNLANRHRHVILKNLFIVKMEGLIGYQIYWRFFPIEIWFD